jgi:stearoyl-CoA desaturase (Delta-9 desaturase)
MFSQHVRYSACKSPRRLTHQQHAFPHDFRSGPSLIDWDPSKWVILALHHFGLATRLRRAGEGDMKEATAYMQHKQSTGAPANVEDESQWDGEVWTMEQVVQYVKAKNGRCVVVLREFAVDVTAYLGEHVITLSLL